MASCLDVSVRSYYDYRNGIYQKRSLQRATNDLFDRKIIGWSFSSDMTDENTTIAALKWL